MPKMEEIRNGLTEKDVIPSIAKLKSEKKFHFDFPAARSCWSHSTSFFLYPIHAYKPLV